MTFQKAALTAAIASIIIIELLIGVCIGAVAIAIHPVLGLCYAYALILLYGLIFITLYEH